LEHFDLSISSLDNYTIDIVDYYLLAVTTASKASKTVTRTWKGVKRETRRCAEKLPCSLREENRGCSHGEYRSENEGQADGVRE
jgi:hypothetical protein